MKKPSLWIVLVTVLSLTLMTGCGAAQLQPAKAADLGNSVVVSDAAQSSTPVASEPAVTVDSSGVLSALEGALGKIYQDVSPSVVYIEVVQTQASADTTQAFPFFGSPQQPGNQYQHASGSGFVWDRAGHIVTNNHVVADADKITVVFSDGTTVPATVVGTDPDSDLAVLKVDLPNTDIQPVQMADSSTVQVGQLAVAIGNPFGLENTMTVGFISALGRTLPASSDGSGSSYTIPGVIQTDAPINPGNSGGVLVNENAQVIGVTSAIVSPVQANAGIGFAVPSSIVQAVVPALIESGHYAHSWLGLSGASLSPDLATAMNLDANQRGALVIEVSPGGPADEAGLQGSSKQITVDGQDMLVGGDVIVAINGSTVADFDDLVAYLTGSTKAGQSLDVTILRSGAEKNVQVTLGERPGNTAQNVSTTQENSAPAQDQPVWLGIRAMDLSGQIAQAMGLSESQQGVLVQEVAAGSPAETAGIRGSDQSATIDGQDVPVGGDVITAWNGDPITGMADVQTQVKASHAGQKVTLSVLRDGHQLDIAVVLEANPAS